MRDIIENFEAAAEAQYYEMLQPDGRLKCSCGNVFNWDEGEVVWAWGQGTLSGPHDATLLEDGHILVYGVDRYVYGMHRSHDLAGIVQREGGAMVAAHPYRRQMPWHVSDEHEYEEALQRASRNPAYGHCAALEKINGRATARETAFSARLCELMGMAGAAGTDAHSRSDIGRCATYFERRIEDICDLIEELKAGRFQAVDLATQPIRQPGA